MNNRIKAQYKSPFLIMYAVALVIWQNFINFLSFFTKFNAAYTEQTATDAIKAINAAKLLPDASIRRALAKKLRKLLRIDGKLCCNQFQLLLAYIEKAFPNSEVAAMKQAAGYGYYLKASRGNLTTLIALNTAAGTFIKENTEALIAAGMPASFAESFTTTLANFDKLNTSYTEAVQAEREETNAKTAANNAVYSSLAAVMRDAKVIFINDATTRAFFTYNLIAVRFKPEGKTGYRFKVTAANSKAPLKGAIVTLQPGNIVVEIKKTGAAEVVLQKGIIYSYTVFFPGFGTVSGSNLQPVPGVIKRIDVALTPATNAGIAQ